MLKLDQLGEDSGETVAVLDLCDRRGEGEDPSPSLCLLEEECSDPIQKARRGEDESLPRPVIHSEVSVGAREG